MPVFSTLGRRILDLTTAVVLLAAVAVAVVPGSPLRTAFERLRLDHETSSAVRRLWKDLSSTASPLDSVGASIELVMLSDYECPFCRTMHTILKQRDSTGISVGILHTPGPFRQAAQEAAIAAICAEEAGRFTEFDALLMQTDTWRSDGNWSREAVAAGIVDVPRFLKCLESDRAQQRLALHRVLAESLKVRATPTFVSPRGVKVGVLTLPQLRKLRYRPEGAL